MLSHATLREALRSPSFLVFAVASAMYGSSHRHRFSMNPPCRGGFAPTVYHQALAVTASPGRRQLRGGAYAARSRGRSHLRARILAAVTRRPPPHPTFPSRNRLSPWESAADS